MITDKDLIEIAKQERIPLNAIFMKDVPPKKIKYGGYIINLQDSCDENGNQQQGTHWVGLFIPRLPRQDIIYFDSFGFSIPQSLINWIRIDGGLYKNSRIISNDKQVQDVDSGGCGIYSLFFIQYMSKNQKLNSIQALDKFIRLWSNNTRDNLNLLKEMTGYYKES